MAIQNFLIMKLLRLITPEEIGDIATKHNGGKFLSLTDLVSERTEHKIYRDFSSPNSMDEIHDARSQSSQAKILPFIKPMSLNDEVVETDTESNKPSQENSEHKDNENMSSFILIEKARLKRSQQILKQKEIIDLYQKNSHIDVEQIKGSNNNLAEAPEAGVLVNKKQY